MHQTSSGASSGTAHWSKDFVEHLRTVHFALVTVSTGLILLALSSKPYNPKIASAEIVEILELQRVGSPAWLRKQREQIVPFVQAQNLPSNLTHTSPDSLISLRDEMNHPRQVRGTIHRHKKSTDVVFVFPDDDWFQTTYLGYRAGSPQEFPRTLSEFQEWWNGLLDAQEHYIDVTFADSVLAEGILPGLPERTNYVLLHDAPNADATLKQVKLTKHLDSQKSGFVGRLPQSKQEVFLYTGWYKHVKASQAMLKSFLPHVCPGSFDKSFSDLAKATDGFGALPLDDARKLVSEEAAKSSELFEAFGMKFPANQVTRWGVILLLSVQLYLFVYLKRLTGTLSSTDAGWDVPWIGMDPSLLPRIIVLVTVMLLPCVAVVLLGNLAIQQVLRANILQQISQVCSMTITWKGLPPGSHLRILGFVIATLCAGSLGVLCWKHRPKVNEQPVKRPVSQLFE